MPDSANFACSQWLVLCQLLSLGNDVNSAHQEPVGDFNYTQTRDKMKDQTVRAKQFAAGLSRKPDARIVRHKKSREPSRERCCAS
ncbi:hypothetical protein B0T22DRAFT_465300 [Podospora appendiculata]|uniref:Uncharacterized protein n=1 Tax=Podospora appendiculata TaxID=314037 RepID=A0AAE0X5H6_9PEZI|nr:hypothetical protein B0T22DRAFT_465300 [Podospora appendiculata]